jgi:hypothetical protein
MSQPSLPQAPKEHPVKHECKFARLRKYIRVLRKEFPAEYPVTIYRRNALFLNPHTGEHCCNELRAVKDSQQVYALAYGPEDYPGRFVLFLAYHPDFGFMAESLFHEWAHFLTWNSKGTKEHPLEYFKMYGKIYQRCIDQGVPK